MVLMLASGMLCGYENGGKGDYAGGFVTKDASVLPDASELKNIARFLDGGGRPQRLNKVNTVSYDSAQANTLDINQGYIIDDKFMGFSVASGLIQNGWDVDDAGGGILSMPYNCFKIIDDSEDESVIFSRRYVRQTSGRVVIEISTGLADSSLDGSFITFKDGDAEVFTFGFMDGALTFQTDDTGRIALFPYMAGTNYGIRIIADFETQKAACWVNGVTNIADLGFSAAGIDNVEVKTSDTGTGTLYLNYLGMHKGYLVNENFLTALSGVLPGDWRKSGGQKAGVVENLSQTRPDVYSLKLTDQSADDFVNIHRPFEKTAGEISFEYKFLAQKDRDSFVFRGLNQSDGMFFILVENGKIFFIDAKGNKTGVYPYVHNVWFTVEVRVNTTDDTAVVLINYKNVASLKMNLESQNAGFDGISFATLTGAKSEVLLDDIVVKPILPKPTDYVPRPIKVETGDKLIGMLRCDLWHGSDHLSWDCINGFEDGLRKPLLGWYDDGNPELSDWETKFMVEHGVSFQVNCWYAPKSSHGTSCNAPIKFPLHCTSLHDGYFKSEYSDMLKFSIMITNHNRCYEGISDFKEHLVPFLMEYYFKDPRFLVIDNKPVVTLYDYDSLVSDLGGAGNAAAAVEYLNEQCRAAGFDGITLIGIAAPLQAESNKALYKTGLFDYSCAYGWGQLSSSASGQFAGNTDTQKYELPNLIASATVGFDYYPFMNSNSNPLITDEDFRQILTSLKDGYMTRFPASSLQSRVLMIDNLNEISEGHFITPTGVNGFGYFDAIREVFGVSPGTHTDLVPDAGQKQRINVLYPQDRILTQPPRYPVIPAPEQCENVLKQWDFENDGDTEGFRGLTFDNWCGPVRASDGSLNVASAGRHVLRFENTSFDIPAKDISYLRFRLKGDTSDFDGRVYVMTDHGEINWAYASRPIHVEKRGDGYTDYICDVAGTTLDADNDFHSASSFTGMQIWFYSGGRDIQVEFVECIGQ